MCGTQKSTSSPQFCVGSVTILNFVCFECLFLLGICLRGLYWYTHISHSLLDTITNLKLHINLSSKLDKSPFTIKYPLKPNPPCFPSPSLQLHLTISTLLHLMASANLTLSNTLLLMKATVLAESSCFFLYF